MIPDRWPVEESWGQIHCDGELARRFWISQWPRGEVDAEVLAPLVLAGPPGRSVDARDAAPRSGTRRARCRAGAGPRCRRRRPARARRVRPNGAAATSTGGGLRPGARAGRRPRGLSLCRIRDGVRGDARRPWTTRAASSPRRPRWRDCEIRRLWGEQGAGAPRHCRCVGDSGERSARARADADHRAPVGGTPVLRRAHARPVRRRWSAGRSPRDDPSPSIRGACTQTDTSPAPGTLIAGQVGLGKSALVKTYLARQASRTARGRHRSQGRIRRARRVVRNRGDLPAPGRPDAAQPARPGHRRRRARALVTAVRRARARAAAQPPRARGAQNAPAPSSPRPVPEP